ncbi:hypothetical protein S7335_1292 [Synechococcus sp. PCC 7335]|nr:hypothetical protein S7335_1292 [Synechococcus sp. PCC 7335]
MQSELVEVISEPDDAYWKEPLTLTMTPEQGRKWRDTTI